MNDNLFHLIFHEGKYFAAHPGNKLKEPVTLNCSIDQSCWLTINKMPKSQYELTVGDVVRFGRICYRITQTKFKGKLLKYKPVLDLDDKKKREANLHD